MFRVFRVDIVVRVTRVVRLGTVARLVMVVRVLRVVKVVRVMSSETLKWQSAVPANSLRSCQGSQKSRSGHWPICM